MKKSAWIIIILISVFIISQLFYKRFDLTSDRRFSFSESTKNIIDSIKTPLKINVYLEGELTGDFRLLKNEIDFFLNDLQRSNNNIDYQFINPIKETLNLDSLRNIGVSDISIPTQEKILRTFPYATIDFNKKSTTVALLSNQKAPINKRALTSINQIESSFIKEIYRLGFKKRHSLGLIIHHDELLPEYLDGFFRIAAKDYEISPYTIPLQDKSKSLKTSDLEQLQKYDAILIAKPIKAFSDEDKLVMDQYIMNGGKTLWLTENVDAEMDSLFRSEKIVSFPRETNLTDLFFAYGVRITPSVVKDFQSAFITLAIGQVGNNTAYESFPWAYFPLSISEKNHTINKKINNPVRFEFANPIEILPRDSVKAEVLLTTSPNVQLQKPLSYIDFSEIEKTNIDNYPNQGGVYPLAVLLEGEFPSAYQGRIESTNFPDFKNRSVQNKMIIISDGDFIKNHTFRGQALPLGADKYSMNPEMKTAAPVIYDNAKFIMNSLDYLVGENALMELNDRERQLNLLDKNLVAEEKNTWRWFNLLLPLAVIWLIGLGIIYLRKRRYGAS